MNSAKESIGALRRTEREARESNRKKASAKREGYYVLQQAEPT